MKLFIATLLVITSTIMLVETSSDSDNDQEDSCKRLTAAIRYFDDAYLFFGNKYLKLDQTYAQNSSLRDVYGDWNAPYPDAAVQPFWGYTPFFFSDKYLFWPQYSSAPVEADRDFGGDFFKNGLDAAGYLNRTMVFLKGCHYKSLATPLATGPKLTIPSGIPCSPDAALTEGDNLIVFKGDMLWVVEPDGVQEGMPIPTNLMITLNDIELCEWDGEMNDD